MEKEQVVQYPILHTTSLWPPHEVTEVACRARMELLGSHLT